MGSKIEYILWGGLLFFLSSCQNKGTESVVSQSAEKANIIENLDTLLNKETHADLAEENLSNLDLLRGYHSLKLGLSIDSIVYGSNWERDSINADILQLRNKEGDLIFLKRKLASFDISIPTSYNKDKIKVTYLEILKLKFGEPSKVSFDTTVYYSRNQPANAEGIIYHSELKWVAEKTSLTYRNWRFIPIDGESSTVKIEDNDYASKYNSLYVGQLADSISERKIKMEKIKQNLLKSN